MIAADRQIRRIRFALFRSIMNQEMGWFDTLNPGELSSRLVADLGEYFLDYDEYLFSLFVLLR